MLYLLILIFYITPNENDMSISVYTNIGKYCGESVVLLSPILAGYVKHTDFGI